jgi:hypothetical protein
LYGATTTADNQKPGTGIQPGNIPQFRFPEYSDSLGSVNREAEQQIVW